MSIATFKPNTGVTPKPTLPAASSDNYKGLVYDNNKTPLVSLIAYVAGSPWSTEIYYRQELATHNDPKALDTGLTPEFQQYEAIKKMEIVIDSPLQTASDRVTQTTRVTGTGYIYPFIVPNENDYFIAETGYQAAALFRIVSIERRTFRTDSVHFVEFQMVDFVDRLANEIADLSLKTLREYVFSRERLMEGLAPVLKTETYADLGELKDEYLNLGRYYLDTFYDRGTHTLILPGQPNFRIYDPFLLEYVMGTFSMFEFDKMLSVKQLNKSGDQYLDQPQFWAALFTRDRKKLEYGNQQMRFVRTGQFENNSYIKSLAFARMDMVVYPYKPDLSANSYHDGNRELVTSDPGIKQTTNAKGKVLTYQEKLYAFKNGVIQSYPMVFSTPTYVLTEHFYANRESDLTLLEIMVRDYLASGTMNLDYLKHMVKLYPKMERMEQFYYGPILMTLMRYYEQRAYA